MQVLPTVHSDAEKYGCSMGLIIIIIIIIERVALRPYRLRSVMKNV